MSKESENLNSEHQDCKVGGVILARMDSTRLPGKGLREVCGRPMLAYVAERSRRIHGLAELILATSDRSVDDPLVQFAHDYGLSVFRGSVDDVAGRVLACAKEYQLDGALRINGDSPLNDPETQSAGVAMFCGNPRYDLVCNVFPRSFPVGMSMEVVRTASLEKAYSQMSNPGHFEHVTKYFYETSDNWSIGNIPSGTADLAGISVAVDTAEDLDRFAWMIEELGPELGEWRMEAIIGAVRSYSRA